MSYLFLGLSLSLCLLQCYGKTSTSIQPEQIHVSYGANPTQMVITWVTWQSTNGSSVVFSDSVAIISNPALLTSNNRAMGIETKYIDGGSLHRVYYIHRVWLTNLSPDTQYFYYCGMQGMYSDKYSFNTMPNDPSWKPRIAVYGDMGVVNMHALPFVLADADAGRVNSVLHIGDMAYDMCDDQSTRGDTFMNLIQPLSARYPYMVCVGNHEQAYNFSDYKRVFTMPAAGGDGEAMFWSYNIGPAHIVAISTEFYYFVQYGWKQIQNQYQWLEKDLAEANRNRAIRPWIIVVGHRPMYCSSNDDPEHCDLVDNFIRVGIPFENGWGGTYLFPPEELFYESGVDLLFFAHEHNYERFWPVYNRRVCNGTIDPLNPYHNPRAPVHITTGAGGNQEYVDNFHPIPYPWSAFRSTDYGHTRMTIHNATHLQLEQVSATQGGSVIDSMWLIKDAHGRQTYNCGD